MARQSQPGTTTVVDTYPMCDYCIVNGDSTVPAQYNAKSKSGPWANMCITHFTLYGINLGLGLGQKFVLTENVTQSAAERPSFECPEHGMRHPLIAHWECFPTLMAVAVEERGIY